MSYGMAAMPGSWADFYGCWEHNVIETIDYMLSLHAPDFPITCCVGITVIYSEDPDIPKDRRMVKIYPKVRHGGTKPFTLDHYTGKKSEN